jgi:hypothetical protein
MHRDFLGYARMSGGPLLTFFFPCMFRQYFYPLSGQLLLALRLFHRHQD